MAETYSESDAILLIEGQDRLKERLPRRSTLHLFKTDSYLKAKQILSSKPIKVILCDDVTIFERLKLTYPDPVRILFVDQLSLDVTEAAINRGEVFRFVLNSSSLKEISEAIRQGVNHFDIVSQHKYLLNSLKDQNKNLEKVIYKLEKEVARKTSLLKSIEGELNKSKRYLEQLNTLIAWINASASVQELQSRVEQALSGILPVKRIILSHGTDEAFVKKIKKMNCPTMVTPLIYQKKNLGHLYFLFNTEAESAEVYQKLELVKQVSDTVALTLEKIRIFDLSVKRKEAWEKTFDAIKDPVSLVNRHYDIVRANRAYSQISGMKIQNLVGKKCYEVFQKRKSPCEGCSLQKTLKENQPENFELKSSAQHTYYSTASFPTTTSPSTEEPLAVMYYRDQGEERRLRDQLIQSEKMAEIGILAGSVAHEINNPLGGILAFSQILLSEISKKDPLYADIKEIEKAAIRSKNIVENLLYFSRASKEEDQRPIDIAVVIEKALSLVSLKIRHRNISIQKNIGKVPFIFGDFNQLVQVFLNIFQNSLEALKRKGVIAITARYVKSENKVDVEIEDNGPGIESDELSKIFNPFFTTKNKTQHPGLGLAVIYRIIKDHQGEIKAESDIGKGTKIVIALPPILKKV